VTHAFGEVLLTVGAVMLLFVAYTLWWTGVETGNEQDQIKDQLEQEWAQGQPQPGVS
jgi:sortase A